MRQDGKHMATIQVCDICNNKIPIVSNKTIRIFSRSRDGFRVKNIKQYDICDECEQRICEMIDSMIRDRRPSI